MLYRLSALLLAGGLIAVVFAIAPDSESSVTPTDDCRTFSATPTVSPSPWPTPPFTPFNVYLMCNNTGSAASDLHIVLHREAVNAEPLSYGANPPGCPEPSYTYSGAAAPEYTRVDIDWGVPCVDPGEWVDGSFVANCTTPAPGCGPPSMVCRDWTLDDVPLPTATAAAFGGRSCPVTSPTIAPTPTPSPGACPPRSAPPLPYPSHPPTPFTVGPTSRDVILTSNAIFCNNSGTAASDLHVHMSNPYTGVEVESNAPGCPEPVFTLDPQPWDKLILDVDWNQPCVDEREMVVLRFTYGCGDYPASCPTCTATGGP